MTTKADKGRLMQGVIPYIEVDGAEKAIAFYQSAFGAIVHDAPVKDDAGHVMNAGLEINGGMLMLMDRMEHSDGTPASTGVTGVTMQLVIRDGDLWWNRAVAAGCTVSHPFRPEFWGDRYGRVRDPFGVDWAFNEPGAGK